MGGLTFPVSRSSGLLTALSVVLATWLSRAVVSELVVTHEYLDHSNVDLVLEKMGGEAVPERMQGHRLARPRA